MLKRVIWASLVEEQTKREIAVIHGARRTGKTTILMGLKDLFENQNLHTVFYDFTDPDVISLFENFSEVFLTRLFGELGLRVDQKLIVFMDEIQYFPKIGNLLKLIYDHFPQVKVYASGSSNFLMMEKLHNGQ